MKSLGQNSQMDDIMSQAGSAGEAEGTEENSP